MLTYAQAALLGLLQGITELFPISSLGHSVLVPEILKWNIDQASPQFIAFVVMTHLATALVLLGFFYRDWVRIVTGMFRSLALREIRDDDTYAKLGWLLVVSTIPAGVIGLLFQDALQTLFAAGTLVACALIGNGFVLLAAEWLRTRAHEGAGDDSALARLSWTQATLIGLSQCLALVPGFSRTGAVMTGGLVSGLSHENAARYSFLLATPIILAAALLKLPDALAGGGTFIGTAFLGAACAAVAAYVSVRFLVRYFERKTLTPFALYCICAGIVALAILH